MTKTLEKEDGKSTGKGDFVVRHSRDEGDNVYLVTVKGASGKERAFKIYATKRSNRILRKSASGLVSKPIRDPA